VHHGRIVKSTGDRSIVEFRSVVDAVRYAIEVQKGLIERNAGVPEDKRIQFRVGVHVADVVEESDGDLIRTRSAAMRASSTVVGLPNRSILANLNLFLCGMERLWNMELRDARVT
jgi:class 3 adenylate cyclase